MLDSILDYIKQLDPSKLGLGKPIGNIVITSQHAGHSRVTYFLEIDSNPFSLKTVALKGKRDKRYFQREYESMQFIKHLSIAPKVYLLETEKFQEPVILMETIPGRNPAENELESILDQIVSKINTLHSLDTTTLQQKDIFKNNYKTNYDFVQMLPDFAEKWMLELKRLTQNENIIDLLDGSIANARNYLAANKKLFSERTFSLLHSDCGKENIIIQPDGKVFFIDWESSIIGDRAFEIFHFLRKINFNKNIEKKFLELYDHKDATLQERLDTYKTIFNVHETLWHAIRHYWSMQGLETHPTARKSYDNQFYEFANKLVNSELVDEKLSLQEVKEKYKLT